MSRKMSFTKSEALAIAQAARETGMEMTAEVNGVKITAKPAAVDPIDKIVAQRAAAGAVTDEEWAA